MLKTLESLLEFFQSASGLKAALEIFLIYLGFYYFIRFCEGTRGAGILKGLAVLITIGTVALKVGSSTLGLDRLDSVLTWIASASTTALIILLQPELRRGLARISQNYLLRDFLSEEREWIDELAKACQRLSKNKIGGLIAIEREDSLSNYVEKGTKVDAELSSELLMTIFFPGTELHDGAIVIQRERVSAAGSLLPLSESSLGAWAGTRHRAAIGLSEETDAIVVVVSEERAEMSLCVRGEIERGLSRDDLERRLREVWAQKGVEDIKEKPEGGAIDEAGDLNPPEAEPTR